MQSETQQAVGTEEELPRVTIDGIDGHQAKIRIKLPTPAQKKELLSVFDYIDERLAADGFREPIRTARQVADFVVSGSRAIGAAHTLAWKDAALVILKRRLFNRRVFDFEEFAHTVLHELLHVVVHTVLHDDIGGFDLYSEFEAKHDITAYALLGLRVPSEHWAFKRYPHLRRGFDLRDISNHFTGKVEPCPSQ